MHIRLSSLAPATVLGLAIALVSQASPCAASQPVTVGRDGIVKVKSAYPIAETITRLKGTIMAKGILFFQEIDQSQLAAQAGVTLRPSTLLIFGNPALGSQFITARPEAGLDWPVRLLVSEDAEGQVWAIYTDFAWIARRHGITNRKAEFETASRVIGAITASIVAE